ncbi:MAG: hypothetical protein V8Q79_02805 [Christensenellales bacterium]
MVRPPLYRGIVQMINQYGGNIPGAQGVPEEMLRQGCVGMAVCKINVGLRPASGDDRRYPQGSLRSIRISSSPRQYLEPGRASRLRDMVRHKIVNVMGCNGKA